MSTNKKSNKSLRPEAAERYLKMVKGHRAEKLKGRIKTYSFDEAVKLFG